MSDSMEQLHWESRKNFNKKLIMTRTENQTENLVKKPILLRVIFILNALMTILPFVFYYVFTTKDISIGGLEPMHMVYTGIAYIVSFGLLVNFILKRNIMGARIMFVINLLIALPVKAYIGIGFAIISMRLSFTQKVKDYFASTGKIGF